MKLVDDHYTYRVTWSSEDEGYIGLCAEFPSLSWFSDTSEEAYSGIRRLVAECIVDMGANNEQVPEPLADRIYSGKSMVRVPPETHRALAIRAAEEGVSLNRLVSARLANGAPLILHQRPQLFAYLARRPTSIPINAPMPPFISQSAASARSSL